MIPADLLIQRRKKLIDLHARKPVLLANGDEKNRTVAEVCYPFRGNSSFIYFFGQLPPGAVGLIEDGRTYLFLEPTSAEQALWHGELPSWDEYAAQSGVDEVRPMQDIVRQLVIYSKDDVHSLPSADIHFNKKIEALIGAEPEIRTRDKRLAESVIKMRLAHDEHATNELRSASSFAIEAHKRGMQETAAGKTEQEIRAAMEYELARVGSTPSYPPIVSVHGEVLHNFSYQNTLQDGELLLADFGAESPVGYASDITRTWPVNGSFSESQRLIYDIVLASQCAAIEAIKPGIQFREIHRIAAEVITKGLCDVGLLKGSPDDLLNRGAYSVFFPHGLGHALGLDVHDMADLGDYVGFPNGRAEETGTSLKNLRFDRELKSGMCITIEPGIYFVPSLLHAEQTKSDFSDCIQYEKLETFSDVRGIRIEDNILVTDDGHENFTDALIKEASDIEETVAA